MLLKFKVLGTPPGHGNKGKRSRESGKLLNKLMRIRKSLRSPAQTSFPSRLPVALPSPRETLGEDHATIEKGKPTSEFDHEFTA